MFNILKTTIAQIDTWILKRHSDLTLHKIESHSRKFHWYGCTFFWGMNLRLRGGRDILWNWINIKWWDNIMASGKNSTFNTKEHSTYNKLLLIINNSKKSSIKITSGIVQLWNTLFYNYVDIYKHNAHIFVRVWGRLQELFLLKLKT